VLARFMFGDEDALIRFDMTEYMEKFNVSRLVGAPPGYVGYEEGGQLTEKVRRKQYAVVLFDEIEKAHPDVFNILLQLLDDGQITDSLGRKVSFKNTVVIMTSNIASTEIRGISGFGFGATTGEANYESIRDKVMTEVKRFFRPEFLNRVDEVLVFRPLDRKQMEEIVEIQLRDLSERLQNKKLTVELTQTAKDLLVQEGFDPQFGARPIKRALRRLLEDPLAEEVLRNRFKEHARVTVDRDGDRLVFIETPTETPAPVQG